MKKTSARKTSLAFECVLVFVSFLGLLVQTVDSQQLNLYEGSDCQAAGLPGICRRVTDCPRALNQLHGGRRRNPVICSFLGSGARSDLAIVCCPSLPTGVTPPTLLRSTTERPGRPFAYKTSSRPILKTSVRPGGKPTLRTTVKPNGKPTFRTTPKPIGKPTTPTPLVTTPTPLVTTPTPLVNVVKGNETGKLSPSLGTRMNVGEKARKACDDLTNEIPLETIPLIYDGVDTVEGEFPHMALLGFQPRGGGPIGWNCGGSLISHLYVLTAAHCLRTKTQGSPVKVRLGEYDLNEDDNHTVDFGVAEIIVHPEYKATAWYDDIGLIKLDRPAKFTTHIYPACLYTKPEEPSNGLIITGWGATTHEGGEKSTVLQKGKNTLSPVPASKCVGFYKGAGARIGLGIQDGMFCAGDPLGSVDTCRGDSGGPIQVTVDSQHETMFSVVGVTSGGPGLCGGRTPAIYSRVYNYLSWIEGIVW